MFRLSVALILLAGTASLAQAPASSNVRLDSSSVLLRNIPVGTDCPIGFRAERHATSQILSASSAPSETSRSTPALGLHLTLDHRAEPAIESIEVTVYGVSPRGRVTLAELQPDDLRTSDAISKSFQLQRSTGKETLSNVDVWMHQVGALRWVDLNEIHYTDGTSWRPSAAAKCRAVPSNLVLVGQR